MSVSSACLQEKASPGLARNRSPSPRPLGLNGTTSANAIPLLGKMEKMKTSRPNARAKRPARGVVPVRNAWGGLRRCMPISCNKRSWVRPSAKRWARVRSQWRALANSGGTRSLAGYWAGSSTCVSAFLFQRRVAFAGKLGLRTLAAGMSGCFPLPASERCFRGTARLGHG